MQNAIFCIFASCNNWMIKRTLGILLMALLLCTAGFGQKKTDFRTWEDSLIHLRNEVMAESDETTRLALNEDFMSLLESVLQMPDAFKFTWDSVNNFSVLASPDNVFKIFTWYIVKNNYDIENFGFIQVYNESRKKYVLYPLYDKRQVIDYPKTQIGNHNRWYGAAIVSLELVLTFLFLLGSNKLIDGLT